MCLKAKALTDGPLMDFNSEAQLPPKQRYQLQQKRAREKEVLEQQPEVLVPLPGDLVRNYTEGSPNPKADEEHIPKRTQILTSKILGIAPPHKPRIGPEFQAIIPPLESRPGPSCSDLLDMLRPAAPKSERQPNTTVSDAS